MTSNQDFGSRYPTTGETPVGAGGYPREALPPTGYGPATAAPPYTPPLPGAAYPTQPAYPTDPAYSTSSGPEPSTAEVAKDQAANVAGSAADAAQQVAGVAKEQVGQVTAEAGRQVKQLLGQAQSELSDQAQLQQQKAAAGLHALGVQLSAMARGSDQPGVATDLAEQAGQKAHEFAGWLEDRDPGSVLDEVRSFARRRPGAFLAMALGAGVLAGRLARGLAADPEDAGTGSRTPPTPRTDGYRARPATSDWSSGLPALDVGTASIGGVPTTSQSGLGSEAYGTGQVPDWTGRPADDLGQAR